MKDLVLIVEDEKGIADAVTFVLESEGFETEWVTTGSQGLALLSSRKVAMVVLDVGLPDMSGFEVLKEIRSKSRVPVLILTARSDEIDRVLGLELGSDDYMVKPFSPREMSARVKNILRRFKEAPGIQETSVFSHDEEKQKIYFYNEELDLTRYEYRILALLVKRPGWIFTRDMIMEQVWHDPGESYDRTVDTHIKTIRAKLKSVNSQVDPIETRRGEGYRLKENL
jgi:two-component system, OmpR family, catabolic regulation response regulator CreB